LFSYQIVLTNYRRPNIYFNITSPTPGTFIIALHYKGREKAILEMDLKIDDLLEKVYYFTALLYLLVIDVFRSKKTTNTFSTLNTSS
jgi:Ras GTPase-activating-like protein IQGAP2/3